MSLQMNHPAKMSVIGFNNSVIFTGNQMRSYRLLNITTQESRQVETTELHGAELDEARRAFGEAQLDVDTDGAFYIHTVRDVIMFDDEGLRKFKEVKVLSPNRDYERVPDRKMPAPVAQQFFNDPVEQDESVNLSEHEQFKGQMAAALMLGARGAIAGLLSRGDIEAVKEAARKEAKDRGLDHIGDVQMLPSGDEAEYVALASMTFGATTGIITGGKIALMPGRTIYFDPDNMPEVVELNDEEREAMLLDTEGEFPAVRALSGEMIVREQGPTHINWLAGKVALVTKDGPNPTVKGAWVNKAVADRIGLKGRGYRKGEPDAKANADVLEMI